MPFPGFRNADAQRSRHGRYGVLLAFQSPSSRQPAGLRGASQRLPCLRSLHHRLPGKGAYPDTNWSLMNSQLEPPPGEMNQDPPLVCCSPGTSLAREAGQRVTGSSSTQVPGTSDSSTTQLSLLESENSSLRRLIVELLEKNQLLREQLRAARNGNIGLGAEITRNPRVDPQAA